MSMFMPEGSQGAAPPGTSSVTPTNPQTTQEDIALMQRVFKAAAENPLAVPSSFWEYIPDFLETQRLEIPIGQVFGFSRFTADAAADVHTNESTTSTSFVDLTTAGPSMFGLASGHYIIAFGAACYGSAANVGAVLAPSIGGAAALDANRVISTSTTAVSVSRIITATLAGASNDIVMKYRVDTAGQAANFLDRWLVVLRYANL